MPYCTECGAEVDAADNICYSCGTPLSGGEGTGGRDQPGDRPPDQGQAGEHPHEPADRQGEPAGTPGQPPHQPGQAGGPAAGGQEQQGRGGTYDHHYGERGGQQSYGGPRDDHGRGPGAGQYEQHREPDYREERYIEDGKAEYALFFPITGGYQPLIFGTICYFLSFLILPIFTLYGYVYWLIRGAAFGDTIQPEFDEFVELTKDGFFYFVYSLLVFILVGMFVIATTIFGFVIADDAGAGIGFVLSYFASLYFLPAVLVLYPVTGSFGKALSPNRISDFALTSHYLVAVFLYIALSIALAILIMIGIVILAITVVGLILVFLLIFVLPVYIYYFSGSYWGGTYFEAVQKGLVPHPEADEQGPAGHGDEYY